MKVALVCDWLTEVGGAEKVLLKLHQMYPKAPIFTSQYNPKRIDWFRDAEVKVGWMRIFPSFLRRFLGVFRVKYFRKLDLSDYDLVISVTGAEAKGIKTKKEDGTGAKHICYCHVPTQYYWQLYDDYVKNPGFGALDPIVRFFFKVFVKKLREEDFKAAQLPDYFVTISEYAKGKIKKYYKREAVVVAPPVEVEKFSTGFSTGKGGNENEGKVERRVERRGFITTSRQVTWKKLDLAVEVCVRMKRPLLLVGQGPEHKNLMQIANENEWIKFLPTTDTEHIREYLNSSEGFLFPSLEPFGIAPVEALAAGCPVIAYGHGGSRDFIEDGVNGVFFMRQSVKELEDAIRRFDQIQFDEKKVRASAEGFSEENFVRKMEVMIEGVINEKN